MKMAAVIGALFGLLIVAQGCKETQKIAPETQGGRGETCLARNECKGGLACIDGVCSKNDFDIKASAKHCDQVDCSEDADCCGDKPREAPAKCAARDSVCATPTLADCSPIGCTSSTMCGEGACGLGQCSNSSVTACDGDGDCADTCVNSMCSQSFRLCTEAADCSGTCLGRSCDCDNPEFNPADPICTDPECDDLCFLRCEGELCVPDNSCEEDADCFGLGLDLCDSGRCVDCQEDSDCDAARDEECVGGFCQKPCVENEECALFHQCKQGKCVETGCTSDRECILATGNLDNGTDARLAECLPSKADPKINSCKVPCENDGECGSDLEVCEDGYCLFVGCESDDECRAALNLQLQQVNDEKPYVSKAVCRE